MARSTDVSGRQAKHVVLPAPDHPFHEFEACLVALWALSHRLDVLVQLQGFEGFRELGPGFTGSEGLPVDKGAGYNLPDADGVSAIARDFFSRILRGLNKDYCTPIRSPIKDQLTISNPIRSLFQNLV